MNSKSARALCNAENTPDCQLAQCDLKKNLGSALLQDAGEKEMRLQAPAGGARTVCK